MLLVYNTKVKDWNFPGGKIEPNEEPEQAVVREVKEEINLDITHLEEILETDVHFFGKTAPRCGYYFNATADLSNLVLREPTKITTVRFLTREEAIKMPELSTAVLTYFKKVK